MRLIIAIASLAVCLMHFTSPARAPDAPPPATRPVAAAQLDRLRADMDDFLAAVRQGDRRTALKYIGSTSPRKQQVTVDVHIAILHGAEVFQAQFKEPATGLLAELARALASRLGQASHLQPDGSARSPMLHYIKSPEGIWQIDAAEIHPRENARTYEAEMTQIERLNATMFDWTDSVSAGKYPTPAVASEAFETLVSQATSRTR